jgi:hypothetical protein
MAHLFDPGYGNSARGDAPLGSGVPPFFLASRIEGQSLPWRKCFTLAPRGQELPLHWPQVVVDLGSLHPSSLAAAISRERIAAFGPSR